MTNAMKDGLFGLCVFCFLVAATLTPAILIITSENKACDQAHQATQTFAREYGIRHYHVAPAEVVERHYNERLDYGWYSIPAGNTNHWFYCVQRERMCFERGD